MTEANEIDLSWKKIRESIKDASREALGTKTINAIAEAKCEILYKVSFLKIYL